MKPSWDEYGLALAQAASIRSSCVRSKVGSVILDRDHRVRSTGYNDSPAGTPGCEQCPRRTSGVKPGSSYDTGVGTCLALHAELNAVLYANREDLDGATLYVTRAPCHGCSRVIRGTRIARIVYINDSGMTVEEEL